MITDMERLTLTPPEKHGVGIIVDYFREMGPNSKPVGPWRLRFMVSVPITARLNRRVGGEAGLEVGSISEGSLDIALNVLNYYVPPETDGREMIRAKMNFVSATAYDLHREFCRQYLAPMEYEGGKVSDEEIMRFIENCSSSTAGPELFFDRKAQREGAVDPPVILNLADDEDDDDWFEEDPDSESQDD